MQDCVSFASVLHSWAFVALGFRDITALKPLSPVEFRAALRYIFGLPFRKTKYSCPDCGKQVDAKGLHAVICQRSSFTRNPGAVFTCGH